MALISKELFVDAELLEVLQWAAIQQSCALDRTLNHPVTRYSLIWECSRKHALQISQKYESAFDRRDQCKKRV